MHNNVLTISIFDDKQRISSLFILIFFFFLSFHCYLAFEVFRTLKSYAHLAVSGSFLSLGPHLLDSLPEIIES